MALQFQIIRSTPYYSICQTGIRYDIQQKVHSNLQMKKLEFITMTISQGVWVIKLNRISHHSCEW